MKKVLLASKTSLYDFVHNNEDYNVITFMVQEYPKNNNERTIAVANLFNKNGYRSGVEITVSGVSRSRRVPMVAIKGSDLYIGKVCSSDSKLEETILTLSDISDDALCLLGDKINVTSLVIFNDIVISRLSDLARSCNVDIIKEKDLNGLFN